jgi:hypothetical protein
LENYIIKLSAYMQTMKSSSGQKITEAIAKAREMINERRDHNMREHITDQQRESRKLVTDEGEQMRALIKDTLTSLVGVPLATDASLEEKKAGAHSTKRGGNVRAEDVKGRCGRNKEKAQSEHAPRTDRRRTALPRSQL